MMGPRQVDQAALFYEFSLERHVPATHLLRSIDRFIDLSDVRSHLAPFYSSTGRPSIDPELLVRMLLVGYCYGIRSERRLCEEVHLNLAYRWFCRLGLDGEVPDHSTFSKNRHGRFRDCDLLRKLFETVVRRCMTEGLVEGAAFAVDASLIAADANKQRSAAGSDDVDWEAIASTRRSVREYLDTLDEAASGAASETVPKFISKSDPAAQWTGAHKGHAFFAYADNYLIDLKAAIIIDVEATRAIRQAEVGAARTMIERTEERLGLCPERLAADSAYGSAEMLGWLVNEHAIEPHIPVFDKSARDDGTFSREDFAYDQERDLYVCPADKVLSSTGTLVNDGAILLYRASKHDCDACELKPRCCPKMPSRKVPRSIHESLAKLLRAGELTVVWVPDERHEAMRDLSRARQAVKKDLQGKRQQISSLMLRLGRIYPGKTTWGPAHMKWLMAQKLEHREQRITFEELLDGNLLQRTAGPYMRVKLRRTQCEQMFSGLNPKADIARYGRHVSKVAKRRRNASESPRIEWRRQ